MKAKTSRTPDSRRSPKRRAFHGLRNGATVILHTPVNVVDLSGDWTSLNSEWGYLVMVVWRLLAAKTRALCKSRTILLRLSHISCYRFVMVESTMTQRISFSAVLVLLKNFWTCIWLTTKTDDVHETELGKGVIWLLMLILGKVVPEIYLSFLSNSCLHCHILAFIQ